MKFLRIISAITLFIFCTIGCINTLDFKGNDDMLIDGITINAIVSPDTAISMYVTKALFYQDVPAKDLQINKKYEYLIEGDTTFHKYVLSDADIDMSINGTNQPVVFDSKSCQYVSSYKPNAGDNINMRISHPKYPDATVSAIIPIAQSIEVLNIEKYYSKNTVLNNQFDIDNSGSDTIARITLRITENQNTTGYYRLNVRSANYDTVKSVWYFSDYFDSDDVLFRDENITKEHSGWDAYFSPYFDNHLFSNNQYTTIVETRLRKGENRKVIVELQTLDRHLYFYQRTLMLSQIIEQDSYTEAIQIHSNVTDGWGILGTMATSKQIITINP